MIAIIDYGMGNLHSVLKACEFLGEKAVITDDYDTVMAADRVILPGVGAFGDAMRSLQETGMDRAVLDAAAAGKPLLGICLGMQLMYEASYEGGYHAGLGLLRGEVTRFAGPSRVPQMGWNVVTPQPGKKLLAGLPEEPYVYFVHSFRVDGVSEDTAGVTDYDGAFTAAAERGNIMATQFHPEKSGDVGLAILSNFIGWEEA